jgi:hypothetical protein
MPKDDGPTATGGQARWPGAASTPASPTSPGDYAALEGVFVVGLAGVVALARRRGGDDQPMLGLTDLGVLSLATFALADTIAKQKVSTWLREPFVVEDADHKPVAPEGDGLRHAIGELLTCTRCVGTWSALALVGLRVASPTAGATTATVLALAGANDVIQAGFRLLSEHTNQAIIATDHARAQAHRA